MNFTYDKKADAISFVIKPGAGVVRDVELAPNVMIGYAKDGSVTEIQILQAAAAILGVSDRTLQRRIEEGFINPKKVGREYQLTPKDIEKLKKAE